jgi:hypothetical protein
MFVRNNNDPELAEREPHNPKKEIVYDNPEV